MELIDRLQAAYGSLLAAGIIRNRGTFAQFVGANQATVSRAFAGDPKYLTENFVSKVEALAGGREVQLAAQGADTLPVLPIGARAGSIADWCGAVHEYDCEKIVSPIRGASLAAQVTGDSMSPEFPSGSQILVKKIDEAAFIAWGEVYLLDTVNGPVLKRVRKTEREDVVECVSINPAYQPFRVECRSIIGWYRVLMCLSLK